MSRSRPFMQTRLAPLAIAVGILTMAGVSRAGGEVARGTHVAPGAETRVFVMTAFDAQCRQLGSPRIAIDVLPGKGTVTLREGQETVVEYSLSGRCIGTRVAGTGIYYTASRDGAGADTFTISAHMPGGEVATRTFKLQIAP